MPADGRILKPILLSSDARYSRFSRATRSDPYRVAATASVWMSNPKVPSGAATGEMNAWARPHSRRQPGLSPVNEVNTVNSLILYVSATVDRQTEHDQSRRRSMAANLQAETD